MRAGVSAERDVTGSLASIQRTISWTFGCMGSTAVQALLSRGWGTDVDKAAIIDD